MSRQTQDSGNIPRLAGGKLGTWGLVFLVMSAAAPITVAVSGAPLSVSLGGIGAPGALVGAGVVLLLFAIGFTAMSEHVRDAGAFYAYTTHGLGKVIGAGIAAMTTFGYAALLVGFYGIVGYFANLTVNDLVGLDLPWWLWSIVIAAIVGALGYRQIDIGAKVLAVLCTAEVALLLISSFAVLIKGGPEPLSLAPFYPSNWLTTGSAGVLIVLGFGAYIGFEGTAIYSEEAKRPERTIPRATYIAIAFLGLFYAFTLYCFIAAFGVTGVVKAASEADFANLPFVEMNIYLGEWAVKTTQVLLLTSFLACIISFHNACSRYLFSLGRTRLLPSFLGHVHPKHESPDRASLTLSGISVAAVLVALILGWSPFLDLGLKPYASGVLAIIIAQAVCALAVVAFFWRDRRGHSAARVLIAPTLATVGLVAAVYLIAANFSVVSGLHGATNAILVCLSPLAFVIGVIRYVLGKSQLVEVDGGDDRRTQDGALDDAVAVGGERHEAAQGAPPENM